MKVVGIIPARFESSRFPGKPLADILGKSMIQRVYEQCQKCALLSDVIVATDDERILNHVIEFGGRAMITSKDHQSGTDRCNEVAQQLNKNYDVIVNIQGDEPYINPTQIEEIIALFDDERERLVKDLGENKLMILRNHGTLALGKNAAEAFTSIYFLEKACTYQVRAMAGSLEFNMPSDAAIETTNKQGQAREMAAALLWPAVKRKMENLDPSFMN